MVDFPQNEDAITSLQTVKPQWFHPYLEQKKLLVGEVEQFAYDYYLKFLPFFKGQAEGNLNSGVAINFSSRMRHKLGQADLFNHSIKMNQSYFCKDPRLLPYTLFHEMVHLWLYDCYLDPGHTRRFYAKMNDFAQTGLPVDKDVHIHLRIAEETKFVYVCPGCQNRWYVNERKFVRRSCGYCYDFKGEDIYPLRFVNPRRPKKVFDGTVLDFFKGYSRLLNH